MTDQMPGVRNKKETDSKVSCLDGCVDSASFTKIGVPAG